MSQEFDPYNPPSDNMGEIVVHPDQTTKQPTVWVCLNPGCRPPKRRDFAFPADGPVCPKCGSIGYPHVQKRVLVHLLIPDPKGPIPGQFARYRLACDKSRDHLATPSNGEAATDSPAQANCPGCLDAAEKLGIPMFRVLGQPITTPVPIK